MNTAPSVPGSGIKRRLPASGAPTSMARRAGFTLIEIVLAMGILTFALVGILGLFPVALDTARESKEETLAAQIAQSLHADIRRAPADPARIMVSGFNPAAPSAYRSLALGSNDTVYIAFGSNGRPWGNVPTAAEYVGGYTDSTAVDSALFIARVSSTFNPPEHPGMARIDISVESPASAPEAVRTKRVFITLKRVP